MRGTSSDGLFFSQSATSLSSKFWKVRNANSLGEGDTCWNPFSHSIEPPQQEGLSILYKHRKEGKLSRNILKDFVLGEDPELFFKRRPDGSVTEDYGPICHVDCWQPVSYSSGHDVGTRILRKHSMRRSPCSRLVRERSRTPRTTKGPLVPSEPRGVSDGNGRRALLLSDGDESERVVKSSVSGFGACPVSCKWGHGREETSDRPHGWLSGKDTKNVAG